MNSFERFQIKHLSPSSLNLWRGAPGLWVVRYIAKIKDNGGPSLWRGSAVEDGLAALLRGGNKPVEVAYNSFDTNVAGAGLEQNEDIDEERALIAPMLDVLTKWSPPSALNATQIRVEYYCDPVPIPIVGYIDLAFDGIDIDLKSTKAIPSSPRPDNARQVSLYRAARNKPGALLYVSAKRHAYYEVGDNLMNECLEDLRAAALSLNNYLARCEDREAALRSLPIDYDHYAAPKVKIPLSEILQAG